MNRSSAWSKGSNSASVELVEYGDFQCPACGAYCSVLKKLHADFPDSLKITYRHFPLPQHKNAKAAACAAEAAGKQGKFLEMHDMLFEHQREWSGDSNSTERSALMR